MQVFDNTPTTYPAPSSTHLLITVANSNPSFGFHAEYGRTLCLCHIRRSTQILTQIPTQRRMISDLRPLSSFLPPTTPCPNSQPKSFGRHSAYRFSLAFQCVANIVFAVPNSSGVTSFKPELLISSEWS